MLFIKQSKMISTDVLLSTHSLKVIVVSKWGKKYFQSVAVLCI